MDFNIVSRHRILAAALLCASAFFLAPTPASAQAAATATFSQWDIFAATGGDGAATQNVASIVRDPEGAAGPVGAVWFTAQNPQPRLGRLDPNAATNNYTEWQPFVGEDVSGGAPLGFALNQADGDMWIAVQGAPSLLLKTGFTNTFRRFETEQPLAPQGLAIAPDGSLYAALPTKNAYGQGKAILHVPRNLTSSSFGATMWRLDETSASEPKYVALDASGSVWYTDNARNTVGRLNPATNVTTEWALPSGSNPVGLQLSGSTVCVVSDGLVTLTGVVQCLDAGANQFTVFAQAGGMMDRPQQLARNSFAELFVTEWSGNSVVFVAQEAYPSATIVTVQPTTRAVPRSSITLYARDVTVTPTVRTVVPSVTPMTGTDLGNGQTRFALPQPSLSYPFALTGQPQPFGITAAFNDFERGSGTAFLAEYFMGPLGRYPAARIDKIEVVAARVIDATPGALQFSMTSGGPAPGSQAVALTEAKGLSLDWTATASQPWVAVSPGSGAAPASVTVSVDPTALGVGTHGAVVTFDDGPGRADPKHVAVTFVVEAAPSMQLSTASLTFAAAYGAEPSPGTFFVENAGGGTLDCAASADQPWIVVVEDPSCYFTVSLSGAPTASGTHSGTITVTSPGSASSTLTVTLTREAAAAAIAVTPPALTFNVLASDTAPVEQTVTVQNTGGQPLTWSAAVSGEAWLTLAALTTDIEAGGTRAVTATVSPAGIASGGSATITITSNGSATPVQIPVVVNVVADDTTPPVLTLPANLTAEATGGSGAAVTLTASAEDEVSGTVAVTCTPASGATFPLGNTLVTCTAADAAGNGASATFTVTVEDTTPPSLSVPGNITVPATSAAGAPVTFTATATDAVSGSLTATCSPEAGAFPVGTTTVMCSAQDAAGNTATGQFTVTVTPPPAQMSFAPSSMIFKTGRLAYCNGVPVGPNWKDQGLVLSNPGGGALSFAVSTGTAWVRVSPASGSVPAGGSLTLTVSVDLTALGQGIYAGGFTVAGNGSGAQSVPVTLEIGNALPTLCLTPTTMGLGTLKANSASTTQSFNVTNVGDDPIAAWSSAQSTSDGAIQMSATSGSLPATVTLSVKAGRKKGDQSGTITVTAGAGSGDGGGGGGGGGGGKVGKNGGRTETTTTTTTTSTVVNGTQTIDVSWMVQ